MSIFLETPRLELRAFVESDLTHLVELDGDPQVMRFIDGGRPTSVEAVRERVLPRLRHVYPAWGLPGFWAARERDGGRFVGWFELRPLAEDGVDVVELGYRLRRDAWGLGYATEGSRALLDRGFAEPGLREVTANTMSVNRGSRRVLEKLGLTLRRTYFGDWPEPIEGSEHGEVEYTITRAEWLLRTRPTLT
ncbi:GNAT family N-acetyltransferase [Embleya scabrispora]|uniref:GNAT family N-acetyltransferase n=1 Tax=Embleya scabrispora TaxID=159449 RepID=A0A1T3NPA8_9ACTN|nr:GNAT family N-acetyltransferase [Embleya scabrispora]OPC78707.1 GNAT family N-acetyltransferase [Embleya scabrispora]